MEIERVLKPAIVGLAAAGFVYAVIMAVIMWAGAI